MDEEHELNKNQTTVLQLILESFQSNGQWPTYRWLNQIAFVQQGMEFDAVYESLRADVVIPDPRRRMVAELPPDTPIKLTLRGVAALCKHEELDAFVSVVRELGTRAAKFVPQADERGELAVTSTEVAAALGRAVNEPSIVLAKELILNSLWEIWASASGGEGDEWTISLTPEKARRYRAVQSLSDVLEAHAPVEAERQDWARAVATPPLEVEATAIDGEEVQPDAEFDTAAVPRDAVFVIYGRNEAARAAMFEFLTALGLEPLTWEKLLATTGEAAPYVGQVLSAGFSVAQAVVVLLTPDDEARLLPTLHGRREPVHETQLTPQARPNVLFEAGMALMSHPTQTVLVELGQLRPFSDVAGRHAIRMNDSVEQRLALADRLRTAGCSVSLDGDWRHAGDFAAALDGTTGEDERELAQQSPNFPRFALQADITDMKLDGEPVTLRVENHGPSDLFEATVVALDGGRNAQPPWYVRWRNSDKVQKEILTDHEWILEVCRDDAAAGVGSSDWTPGWRFFQPTGETLVVPTRFDVEGARYGGPVRATIKVTPRRSPESALTSTLSVSLSERGRAAAWDLWRVES